MKDMDTRHSIGGNEPPSLIDFAGESATVLSDWLKDNPVVETEEQSRAYKLLRDRGKSCLRDMEDERKTRVKPKQEEIDLINGEYRSPRAILEKILNEGDNRLNDFIRKEEERRLRDFAEAQKRVEEAEQAAREAEERERSAADDARAGVETDIGAATVEAHTRFVAFERAQRNLARAERAKDVKISGGFNRAVSQRFKEELVVTNPWDAVADMGWSETLLEALLTEARKYRKLHDRLPVGIVAEGERRV
jgi:hypothetical protein